MSNFVVVGGTGRTGRRVAGLLTADGHRVVVACRGGERKFDLAVPDTSVFAGAEGIVISVALPRDAAETEAVLHNGVAEVAAVAAREDIPVVLVSQLPVSTPGLPKSVVARFEARARGEQALRESGAQYTVIRPGVLHDTETGGARVAQLGAGEGRTSRDTLAAAIVAALFDPSASGKTFELYDAPDSAAPDWPAIFAALTPDPEESR